jgi:23S rRNA pseudouridine1911/1915/1917 synthase
LKDDHELTESHVVSEEESGLRLDVWLHRFCDFLPSRTFAANWVSAGHVTVSRSVPKASLKLRGGDQIGIRVPVQNSCPDEPQPETIPLRIIFEDEHILVINKQPGLVVHPGAGIRSGTLVNGVLAHCGFTLPSLGERERAGIVHRLDRDTSGVMVVAKSQIALSALGNQFASHAHLRTYSALCFGAPFPEQQRIETGYGRHPQFRTRYAVRHLGEGRHAATNIRVVESLCEGAMSLLECSLETGRTHQIRVHTAHLGNPLVGDPVYSRIPESLVRTSPQLAAIVRRGANRQMLHALQLGFSHPVSGESVVFDAPLEPDFANLLATLRSS